MEDKNLENLISKMIEADQEEVKEDDKKEEDNQEEAVDVKKIIKDLGNTTWSSDNSAQMKAVQLLKGLATSEDPLSNKFMKAMDKASSAVAKEVLGEE